MKVLYFVHQFFPEYYTGTERFVFNVANMVQRFGNKVKILTNSCYDDHLYEAEVDGVLRREYGYKGLPVIALKRREPVELIDAVEKDVHVNFAVSILTDEKPDIVHVGHPLWNVDLVAACVSLGIPYVLTLTDFFVMCPKITLLTSDGRLCTGPNGGASCRRFCPETSAEFVRNHLRVGRFVASNAQLVASPSHFLAGFARKELGNLDVALVPHGIPQFPAVQSGYGEGTLVFGYRGSLNHHKGVHHLIQAFRNVRSENVILRIYGSGPDPEYCHSLQRLANGDNRVRFCGVYRYEELPRVIATFDVGVVPSLWYENYPLSVYENFAAGRPVIAANAGGMTEAIDDGVTGLLFARGDLSALACLIDRLAKDASLLESLRANVACKHVPSVEEEAYSYWRIYRSIVH